LAALQETQAEPDGDDVDLISRLNAMAEGAAPPPAAAAPAETAAPEPVAVEEAPAPIPAAAPEPAVETAEVSGEPLVNQLGGISMVDSSIETLFRHLQKYDGLKPYFDGLEMMIFQATMVEYFTSILGARDKYTGDIQEEFRPLAEQGLSDPHFDKMVACLQTALSELEIDDALASAVVAVFKGARETLLCKVEMEAKAAAAAAATKDKSDKSDGAQKEAVAVVQSVRVNVDMLENLMTMVSELVLSRNQLLQMVRKYEDSEFSTPLQCRSLITTDLQEGIMKTRMQPIGNAWSKIPRIVRDLSLELDKKIDLEMIGAETELDRQVLEMIKDPLTHMIRNSGDHGIEQPADRLAAGKPEIGKVVLNAFHEGGHIIIKIQDDGRGIAIDKVREKAVANELATVAELDAMSSKQIMQFIFKAGFSTAEKVTNVSGRGVGMDVVRTNIEKIGGNVELQSEPGVGSTFVVKIPLTLAIVSALIVESGGERFAVPQLSVDELVRVSDESEHRIEQVNATPVLRLRDTLLPLVDLNEVLGLQKSEKGISEDAVEAPEGEGAAGEETFSVILRSGVSSFAVIVDQVFESEEIVVKPVTPVLREISIFFGNTILGDGSVIMILDPNGIAEAMGESIQSEAAAVDDDARRAQERTAAERSAILVFKAGTKEKSGYQGKPGGSSRACCTP
jgi:two-component system chemotaxis sensor kinase CheA